MTRPTQYDEIGTDRQIFDADGYIDKPAPDDRPLDMRVWKSPGPVISAFMASTAPVVGVMGPIGGGKTISTFYKHLRFALMAHASPVDGLRRYRLTTVRETYRQLNKTTIPSWNKYFPKTVGKWQGGGGEPAMHLVSFDLPDGTRLEFWHDFIAIGDQSVEDALRGYESTAFFLNEFDRLPEEVLPYAISRTGRYPDMIHGGPGWHGVTADFNAPNTENHAAKSFIFNKPEEWAFFRQPSGLAPNAENLDNLPAGYYQAQMTGQPEWFVRRMIRNELGYSREGQPVFGEFDDDFHVAKEPIKPDPNLPIVLGGDGGRTPSIVFLQRDPVGCWRVFDEICGEQMGAPTLATILLRRLNERYPGWLESRDPLALRGFGDPASAYAGEAGDEDDTWLKIMAAKTRIRWTAAPAPSGHPNALTPRLEAVRGVLQFNPGGRPGLQLCPVKVPMIREGFNHGYHYRRLKVANAEEYADVPNKNRFSHPHDALQNGILGGGEYDVVLGRDRRADARPRQTRAITDEDPRGGWAVGGDGRQGLAHGLED